jgi:hypothetical protein
MPLPHSATVRGTKGNPNYDKVKNDETNRTQLGDPGSLSTESASSSPVPDRTDQDGGSQSTTTPSKRAQATTTADKDQPHSARVRGTLSNPKTAPKLYTDEAGEKKSKGGMKGEEPASMLGDPVSLKAEKSDTEATGNDRGAGGSKDGDGMKEAAMKRKDNETKSSSSKL